MSQNMLRCFPVAITVAVALALSGCGGGGSATMPDDMPGMTGGTDTGMTGGTDTGMTGGTDTGMTGGTDTGMTGGTDTGMTGGTDTGMTGGGQTLTVPVGLVRSTVPPLFYDENITDDDRGPLFTTPTLASGIQRDYDNQRSGLANDAYIKSLGFADIADDDGIPSSLHVTYVVGDEEVTVHFTDADLDDPSEPSGWSKTIDGVEYSGWFWKADDGAQEDSISLISGLPGYRLYASGGIRTETADLPSGTAVYEGGMHGDTHLTSDPSSGREAMTGSLRLTANFDEVSLEGEIIDIRVRPDNPRVWSDLPNTTRFVIDDGRIVDGQFTASLTGIDTNANAPMDETVRGYAGGVLGEFYGANAEEVAGVLNASRADRVMAGAFGGAVPGTGATGGTGPIVQSGPATLSSAINREWETRTTGRVRHTDTSSVTAIEPDGANGFNVTFNIDGVEHRVHMAASDYDTDSEGYQQGGSPGFSLWFETGSFDGSSEYSHFNVNGWSVCTHGTDPNACSPQTLGDLRVVRGFVVHGDATENLPQGTADYSGRFGGDAYQSDDPNSSTSRARFRGDMTLTADFDNRSVSGRFHDMEVREPDETAWEAEDDGDVMIRNGTISTDGISADLQGTGELAGFTGDLNGLFYGPDAGEVAGVFEGTYVNNDEDEVVYIFPGWFGGKKQ